MSSLSSANRAALAAKEGYWWINAIALALSCVVARMSWAAYADASQPDRALVCIIAQAIAIAAAILARRAFTAEMNGSGFLALLLAGGCSWWASHGLALAWYGDAERNSEPMIVFLAVLEPALFLLAEHVREGRQALRKAHQDAAKEQAEELERIRQREQRQRPMLAASGGVALAALPTGASAGELAPASTQPSERPAYVSTNVGYPSARAHAVALKRANPALTQPEAAVAVGAPRSTVGNWWRAEGLSEPKRA